MRDNSLADIILQMGEKISSSEEAGLNQQALLRYALVNAAWNVARNNATFKAYYAAKRAEGRTHYNVLGRCSGKLVRII